MSATSTKRIRIACLGAAGGMLLLFVLAQFGVMGDEDGVIYIALFACFVAVYGALGEHKAKKKSDPEP